MRALLGLLLLGLMLPGSALAVEGAAPALTVDLSAWGPLLAGPASAVVVLVLVLWRGELLVSRLGASLLAEVASLRSDLARTHDRLLDLLGGELRDGDGRGGGR